MPLTLRGAKPAPAPRATGTATSPANHPARTPQPPPEHPGSRPPRNHQLPCRTGLGLPSSASDQRRQPTPGRQSGAGPPSLRFGATAIVLAGWGPDALAPGGSASPVRNHPHDQPTATPPWCVRSCVGFPLDRPSPLDHPFGVRSLRPMSPVPNRPDPFARSARRHSGSLSTGNAPPIDLRSCIGCRTRRAGTQSPSNLASGPIPSISPLTLD